MAGISSKKIADLRNQHGQTAQRFEYLIVKSVKNAGAQLAWSFLFEPSSFGMFGVQQFWPYLGQSYMDTLIL